MARTRRHGVLAIVALFGSACGYLHSGRWHDDPRNWPRALGGEPPANVEVLHSYYWRAPHFTYESGYFFAIRDRGGFRAELFARNRLVSLGADEASRAKRELFGQVPAWFVPKPADRYEVWMYADEPRGHFRIFIDREDGTVFLSDFQG